MLIRLWHKLMNDISQEITDALNKSMEGANEWPETEEGIQDR